MIFFLDTSDDVNMKVITSDNWRIVNYNNDNNQYALIINDVVEYIIDKNLRDKFISSLRGITNVKRVYIDNKKKILSVDNGL